MRGPRLGENAERGQRAHGLEQRLLPGAGGLRERADRTGAFTQQIRDAQLCRQSDQSGAGNAEHHGEEPVLRGFPRRRFRVRVRHRSAPSLKNGSALSYHMRRSTPRGA
jgi:hypothetical protein